MFTYNAPTKLFIDCDINSLGEIILSYGYKKVLLVYGGGSIKKSGLYDLVVKSLNDSNIIYYEAPGVEPNPKVSFVREVLNKKYDIDMVLAVGGGSVIDASKSIAVCYADGGDPWEYNSGAKKPSKALPLGVILTHSAAGSEMSASTVLTNAETNEKLGYLTEVVRPKFAIMNPELTCSLSKFQTACGVVDIMMHTLERYINGVESMLADEFAIGLLKTVVKNGLIAYNEPNNYQARKEIMLASSFSHNGLTNIGRGSLLRVHTFEHVLSGLHDEIAHGAGLAVAWPAYSKYIYKDEKVLNKFVRLAYDVFNVIPTSDLEADAYLGILKMEEFFKKLGMPSCLEDLGMNHIELDAMVEHLTKTKPQIVDVVSLDKNDIREIFKLMFKEVE